MQSRGLSGSWGKRQPAQPRPNTVCGFCGTDDTLGYKVKLFSWIFSIEGKVSLCAYSCSTDLFTKISFLFSKTLKCFGDIARQENKVPATGNAVCAHCKTRPPLGWGEQYGEHIAAKRSENAALPFCLEHLQSGRYFFHASVVLGLQARLRATESPAGARGSCSSSPLRR